VCVFLCGTRRLSPPFDLVQAQAERGCLQLIAPKDSQEMLNKSVRSATRRQASSMVIAIAVPGVMKRSAWIQAHCRRIAKCHDSTPDWQKALDAVANAWCRLLALIGLRW
jgi:hypothetical protein